MKKTIALTIIAMFVFSMVPFAFADEGSSMESDTDADVNNSGSGSGMNIGSNNSIKIRDIKEDIKDRREDLKDAINIDRQRCLERCKNESDKRGCEAKCRFNDLKEDMKDLKEDMKERMREGSNKGKTIKIRNAAELNIRHLPSEKIEMLRERFEHAKENFKDAKERLDESRKELKDAIRRGDQNATINSSKEYLLHTTDVLINHLEKVKAKVQENENIPNATEARIVAEIDAQISDLNSIKADIQAATTKEQIKEIAKDLRKKWNELKHLIKLYTSRVVSARVEGIVNLGLVLEKRLDKVLQRLNQSNTSVDVSSEVDAFKAKIALSRDKYRQAQAKITEALDLRAAGEPADSETIKSLMEQANSLLKEAREALKEAHDILKEIVRKIRQANIHVDLSSEVEVEVEDEDDDLVNATAST